MPLFRKGVSVHHRLLQDVRSHDEALSFTGILVHVGADPKVYPSSNQSNGLWSR
jgi:hypothetical protein